ncbi:elongation factor Ts [gamma proteobacterium BDW918]|jgi:elongation factor Ts|uniref:Elongation factor Ts n=1 Tax=Zhongshania aliphaticivorans TaxID=1470434 RepID=A0A127M756_9GAMM|nr:translation elongation factor Ts [Zhongshania aliphaticivorans]AMO69069.1 elongation factor Ts [Zhongshania aliphaticivorans]EIF43665.1 elongation factor Ts [gamma proteobacterium BDW918]|tara:strand:- start:14422 stop:15285 length:864 start_codon:yes stop_codon:yes gene_type:complete
MAVSASMVKELRDRTGLGMMECKKALNESNGDIDLAIEELRKSSGMKAAKKAGRTAADGVVTTKVAEDGSYGVVVEVNSETDFAAREPGFQAFAALVTDKVFATKETDIAVLMAGELESAREALVQKIGENIGVRRALVVTAEDGVVDSYVHSNNRIAVLVALKGGDAELARDVAMHVAAVNPRVAKAEDMPAEEIEKEREIFTAQAAESGKPAEIIEKMIDGRIRKFLSESSLVDQAFVKDPEVTVGKLLKSSSADIQEFVRFEVGEGIEKEEVDFAAEVAAQLKG